MKNILILLFLSTSLFALSQEVKFVNAPNGLIIRNAPNKGALRIGKLNYGVSVNTIKETGIKISIKDNNEIVNGQWVEIHRPLENKKGFVFDGYLTTEVMNKGKEIKNFYVTQVDSVTQKKYWKDVSSFKTPQPASVYLRDKKHKDLIEFSISELEFYDDSNIKEIEVDNLSNITKVILVEFSYSACCSNTDEYYYLLNANNDLIPLPEISNMHCDGPEPFFEYIFPNNKKGIKNKILYAKTTPNLKEENTATEVLKTFSWGGMELKLE